MKMDKPPGKPTQKCDPWTITCVTIGSVAIVTGIIVMALILTGVIRPLYGPNS